MSGHRYVLYRSNTRVDMLEDRVNVYVPRVDLPKPPPPVIRMTLEWTEKDPEDGTRRVP